MTFEAMELRSKDQERQNFENAYRKGVGAALLMCTFPLRDDIKTNMGVVEGHIDCPQYIKNALAHMAGFDSVEEESKDLWKKPTFATANVYLRRLGKQRTKVIGYIAGEEVIVNMVGHVETHITRDDDGDDFSGRCHLAIPGESLIHGFILGSFDISGTVLIIDQHERLYAYSPKNAIDFPWKMMESEGAEIEIDVENNITLQSLPGMIVASLAE